MAFLKLLLIHLDRQLGTLLPSSGSTTAFIATLIS